jgi:hypothetical protein
MPSSRLRGAEPSIRNLTAPLTSYGKAYFACQYQPEGFLLELAKMSGTKTVFLSAEWRDLVMLNYEVDDAC